jgi:hypothetical protein
MTGAAAMEIGGRKSASVFKHMRKKDQASFEDIECFQDTRLSVINEISFAAYHSIFGKISNNLKGRLLSACCHRRRLHLQNQNGIYWKQALTCMVELKGTHHFNGCDNMKTIMPNMQDEVLSTEEWNILNSRFINGEEVKKPNPL